MIVAMDRNRGIGVGNQLPWRLSDDMKRFRELTMGHHLLVGRKTFESIGRPLPGRQMIVLTRDPSFRVEGCATAGSILEGMAIARSRDETELFIGGGGEIYRQALNIADRIYLTLVETEVEADAFFPEMSNEAWVEIDSIHHPADENHQYSFTFKTLVRKT
ncbi:MAG: dihydrofolate reductase [Acidobacteria bacterium]|nr:dihydrofolate reductase [Acidobacteriota bacterium]